VENTPMKYAAFALILDRGKNSSRLRNYPMLMFIHIHPLAPKGNYFLGCFPVGLCSEALST
jgi:hypothetical protein